MENPSNGFSLNTFTPSFLPCFSPWNTARAEKAFFFFFFPRQRRTREEKASRAALSRGDAAQQRAAFALARRLPARSCHLLPTHPERRAHLALLFQPHNSPFVQVTACENSRSASVGSVVPINKSAETTLPLRETRAAQIARDKAEWRWLYPTNSLPSCWSDPLWWDGFLYCFSPAKWMQQNSKPNPAFSLDSQLALARISSRPETFILQQGSNENYKWLISLHYC